ncbi:MAG TPA: hypothetical protein VGQ46_14825 [Thermoanaerobaculia bacterium]|jgi:hypothetical protein|nr:hypothetical protein [Thermoanaerobaculia bacterium]
MTPQPTDAGVIYIAFGESFRAEARQSIATLRSSSPRVACAVVTDSEWEDDPRPDHFVIRPSIRSLYCKPKYVYEASPFRRTLFIDTDTIVVRDLQPFFGLLDYYDVALRFVGPRLGGAEGLEFHPWCATGVLAYRKNDETADLFGTWLTAYEQRMTETSGTPGRGVNEEPLFAEALARSRCRAIALGSDLCFNLAETIITYSPPAVFHGRDSRLTTIAHEINDKWDPVADYHPRLWMPNIKGLLPAGVRHSDPLLAAALILRRGWNEIKRRMPRR